MKNRGLGPHAYTIQTLIELKKRKRQTFEIFMDQASISQDGQNTLDDQVNPSTDSQMKQTHDNFTTQLLMVYNSKLGGGRMILNPTASLNDGHFELIYLKHDLGFGPIL